MQPITNTLLDWFQQHGRTDLPWQNTRDAYRVWVSEIMLQQTQVATVVPYYQRFMQRFATVDALAKADLDEVLHLWTGLGYYARARNLHQASKLVSKQYHGIFPTEFDQVLTLPGIGRSTAGAILAFCEQQHWPILDGNVKRVLARFYLVEGWYGHKAVENQLWQLAEQNTPRQQIDLYTQAIMDFGATQCRRSKPQCADCPLSKQCKAYRYDRVANLPQGKPKTIKPVRQSYMLLIKDHNGAYLLQQKPPSGLWGGLWCPPQVDELQQQIKIGNMTVKVNQPREKIRHSFSHFHLDITPVPATIVAFTSAIGESKNQLWYNPRSSIEVGLAAPVKKLMDAAI